MIATAAYTFAALIAFAALFQLALALGAPWGSLAMGGRFPGILPLGLRLIALVQMGILGALAAIVLARAGIALPEWRAFSQNTIWIVVAFCAVSVIANLATPSKWERIIWAPVAIGLLACSVMVALN